MSKKASAGDRRLGSDMRTEPIVGILAKYAGRPWALRPESLEVLMSALDVEVSASYLEIEPAEQTYTIENGAAIVNLHGVITPSSGPLGALLGFGGGLDQFRKNLLEAAEDPKAERIILDVNSPGGLTDQVPETASLIRDVREHKPITAVANTQAGSAAYWLASQANEVVVTPSGEVGSIGAYMIHTDVSGALEQGGISVTITSAGKYKTEGNRFEPLTAEAMEARQRKVDDMYAMFVDDVAAGRDASPRKVRNAFGEGRMVLAGQAIAEGLADRVAPITDVIGEVPPARRAARRRERMAALLFGDSVEVS